MGSGSLISRGGGSALPLGVAMSLVGVGWAGRSVNWPLALLKNLAVQ